VQRCGQDLSGTAQHPPGGVKGGQKAIPGRLHLVPSVTSKRGSDHGVVTVSRRESEVRTSRHEDAEYSDLSRATQGSALNLLRNARFGREDRSALLARNSFGFVCLRLTGLVS
jgi:hypothetical protein